MAMGGRLAGRTIAVTRPAAQAQALCRAIEDEGGKTFRFPLLEIIPVTDPAVFAPVSARLEAFDMVFFVSPNAVEFGLAGLLKAGAGLPPHVRLAAVGQGSARALEARGFADVISPAEGYDSESVLALPAFAPEAVQGRSVLIVRGNGGRELLGETLARRGARVEYLACYLRGCPKADPAPLLGLAERGRLDAISVTSSESVSNLVHIVGGGGLARLSSVPVFAPHPRIAGFCRRYGLERVITVNAGDNALLHALTAFFG